MTITILITKGAPVRQTGGRTYTVTGDVEGRLVTVPGHSPLRAEVTWDPAPYIGGDTASIGWVGFMRTSPTWTAWTPGGHRAAFPGASGVIDALRFLLDQHLQAEQGEAFVVV